MRKEHWILQEKKSLSREKQLVSTRSLKVTAGLGQPCQSQGWGPLRGGHSAVLLRSRGQHAALGCPPGVVHLQWCATTQGREAWPDPPAAPLRCWAARSRTPYWPHTPLSPRWSQPGHGDGEPWLTPSPHCPTADSGRGESPDPDPYGGFILLNVESRPCWYCHLSVSCKLALTTGTCRLPL